MGSLREIFVKAVCARGRETCQRTHRFRAKYHPEDILGSQVANDQCRAAFQDGHVRVFGSYDVHVWYSYQTGGQDGDLDGRTHTAVAVQTFDFSTPVEVEPLIEDLGSVQNPEVRVRAVKVPRVKDCAVDADGVIHVTIEDGYQVEVVGETTLWVPVYAGAGVDETLKKGDDELWEAFEEIEDGFEDDFADDAFGPGDEEFEEVNLGPDSLRDR